MPYITYQEYSAFHGAEVTEAEFPRLAEDAGRILDSVAQRAISDEDHASEAFKRAVCYEVEMLKLAGGMQALAQTESQGVLTSFSNDGYSESRKPANGAQTIGGMPVASMALAALREMGYLKRWVYAGVDRP